MDTPFKDGVSFWEVWAARQHRPTEGKNKMARSLTSQEMLAAADAADRAANAANAHEERAALMEVFAHQEAIQMGLIAQRLQKFSQTPHTHERLPLRESGDDIGVVETRIPRALFFHLLQQKNFGWEGLTSDEGQRDIRRDYPITRVKTVSGKVQVGYRGANRRIVKRY